MTPAEIKREFFRTGNMSPAQAGGLLLEYVIETGQIGEAYQFARDNKWWLVYPPRKFFSLKGEK